MGQHFLTAYSSLVGAHLLQFKVIWGSETLSQKGSMGRGRMDERREGEFHTILLQSANLHVIMFPAESFCACTEGAVSWFSKCQPCGYSALPQVCAFPLQPLGKPCWPFLPGLHFFLCPKAEFLSHLSYSLYTTWTYSSTYVLVYDGGGQVVWVLCDFCFVFWGFCSYLRHGLR